MALLMSNRSIRPTEPQDKYETKQHPTLLPAPPGQRSVQSTLLNASSLAYHQSAFATVPDRPLPIMPRAQAQASASSTVPMRKRRASRPKTRTGCTTCKIRRIKCDEAKPYCNRCTSTGRKCDGYQFTKEAEESTTSALTVPPPTRRGPTFAELFPPSSLSRPFQGSTEERRMFHRFQACTIPVLAGVSETEFWHKIVLRVGQDEPVVRNAIIALSTLHEDYQQTGGSFHKYQRASQLYGTALVELNSRLSQGDPGTAKLAIIASILFTCFELLRRDGMAAIRHYNAGMRALIQQMPPKDDSAQPSSTSTDIQPFFRTVPQDDVDVMLRIFSRYDIQACTFAKPRAEKLTVTLPSEPPTTLTLSEIKNYLNSLLVAVYQHVRSDLAMFRYWNISQVPEMWILRRDQALVTFEQWLGAIERFFAENILSLTPLEAKALLGLRLQTRVAIMELRTCIASPPEASFDEFEGEFENIVTRTESLLDSLNCPEGQPLSNETTAFTMELGINHPLFFVATKCRHWQIRRRAIACLKRGGREGIWEGPVMAAVAQKFVELEEQGVSPGGHIPEAQRFHMIRKDVNYDMRKVFVVATRSQDGDLNDWKHWKEYRDAIDF